MEKNYTKLITSGTYKSPLYTFVYTSKLCFTAVVLLLSSFVLQGVSVVSANESENIDTVAVVTNTDPVSEVDLVSNSNPDQIDLEETSQNVAAGEALAESEEIETSTSDEVEVTDINPQQDSDLSATTSLDAAEEESSTTTEQMSNEEDISTTNLFDQSQGLASSSSTTAEVLVDPVSGDEIGLPVNVTESDAEFTFDKQECTRLASGSFYCLEEKESTLKDDLFAAPDTDGDLEIFLVRDGERFQVTNNLVDDAAPYYDQNSNTIVWHRLLNDRYQIISYEIDSAKETQLTKTATNNMEPTRQGKYVVWQRWIGNNWDVILYDGTAEHIVTTSDAHDIAPYVHGSLVVWNRHSGNAEKTIEMYNIETSTYVSVNDPEGLSVTNPRMVFVYDSLHPNGDIVTKGYDMIAKKFIALDTLPRSLPDELPESDKTGETRALIQSKPTIKGDEGGSGDIQPEPNLEPVLGDSESTLDLRSTSTTATTQISNSIPSEATEYDLVIAPLFTEASSSDIAVQEIQ